MFIYRYGVYIAPSQSKRGRSQQGAFLLLQRELGHESPWKRGEGGRLGKEVNKRCKVSRCRSIEREKETQHEEPQAGGREAQRVSAG